MRSFSRRDRDAASNSPGSSPDRRGSVIAVVLALTLGLLILAMLFLTDSTQEVISAEYFADSGRITDPTIDNDQIAFDALRQIIIGANDVEKHSPFYGGRRSLLPTMFGAQRTPYAGESVNIGWDGAGNYFVDQNHDGMPDAVNPAQWRYLNDSPSVNGGIDRASTTLASNFSNYPSPAAGYTYPDFHSPFVYYRSVVAGPTGPVTVLIPSYIRPQLLRNVATPSEWYSSNATLGLHMRPHMLTTGLLRNGTVARYAAGHPLAGQVIRRYISTLHPEPTAAPSVGNFEFPQHPTGGANTSGPRMGVWTNDGNVYQLDRDLDGDGVRESILLDMDLGVFSLPDGSKKFVPIVSAMLVPLDSKFDLNSQGNLGRLVQAGDGRALPAGINAIQNQFIHKSNQAVHRSEINPQWALQLGGVPTGGPNNPYTDYFGRVPTTAVDTSNMEWWWLVTGRPEFQGGSITGLLPGRTGESQKMRDAFTTPATAGSNQKYPRAGFTDVDGTFDSNGDGVPDGDDNLNFRKGTSFADPNLPAGTRVFPAHVGFPAYVHPLDHRGRGTYVAGNYTGRRLRHIGQQPYPTYDSYFINPPQWPSALFFTNSGNLPEIDEPGEMIQAPNTANTNDDRLNASRTITLHMSNAHQQTTNRDQDLILKLAPQVFQNSTNAEQLRKLFTSITGDSKTFGKIAGSYRGWEFTNLGGGIFQFPPRVGTIAIGNALDPIRGEVRELLQIRIGDTANRPLQRRLSVNELLDRYPPPAAGALGNLRFRPLTPHVTTYVNPTTPRLGRDPVSGHNSVLGAGRFNIVRPEQLGTTSTANAYHRQEWLARYDRQRMCRDIYMLLYLFGGPNDSLNYATTSNAVSGMTRPVYTDKQLREMAQFAVNLVDARDEDNIPTLFEYDKNPIDGWNLDDDPFTDRASASAGGTLEGNGGIDRGVVIGVERQQLTLSEGLAIFAKRVTNAAMAPEDHGATDYNDTTHHVFSYLELENVTPGNIGFTNSHWQVVIKDSRSDADVTTAIGAMTPYIEERRLTLTNNIITPIGAPSGTLPGNSRFVIGTQNDTSYRNGGNIKPSHFMVNVRYKDPMDAMTPTRIAPAGALDLDLMVNWSRYRLHRPQPSASVMGDGAALPSTMLNPSGRDFLFLHNQGSMPDTSMTPVGIRILLRRRLHPDRQEPILYSVANATTHHRQSSDNPWITVDEKVIQFRNFELPSDMATMNGEPVRSRLADVRSTERRQPFEGTGLTTGASALYPNSGVNPMMQPMNPAADQAYRLNSLNGVNRYTQTLGTRYTVWQPQMDRAYGSVGELLTLPLYGGIDNRTSTGVFHEYKTEVTQHITSTAGGVANRKIALTTPGPTGGTNDPKTAYSRFLQPHLPISIGAVGSPGYIAPSNVGNRWYRVLSLLEIPEADPSARPWFVNNLGRFNAGRFPTTVGAMNLNTMSDVTQLAGLLDEQNMLVYDTGSNPPLLRDRIAALGNRRWYRQFLLSRDGRDPITNLTLPGVPSVSRPFRDLSDRSVSGAGNQLEHTILRSLPQDASALGGRRLFEVGSQDQHANWQNYGHTVIDPTTRYRVLSKAMNNTTNRGNAFLLILRIEYFEAVEVDADAGGGNTEKVVRIGQKLPGSQSPDITTYYVIDRSRAMLAPVSAGGIGIDGSELPRVNTTTNRFIWSFRQDMDFRRFVLAEQRVN